MWYNVFENEDIIDILTTQSESINKNYVTIDSTSCLSLRNI